jgi:hypothetical protein
VGLIHRSVHPQALSPDADADVRLPRAGTVVAAATAAALVAAAAPLLAYALSLAFLGAPHVLAELRYVDGRFGRRLGARRGIAILALLGGIVAVRALLLGGHLPYATALRWELAGVAVLAFVAVPDLIARPARAALGLLIAGTLVLGAALDPLHTIVVLAVLHNATPVGFLAERLRGGARRRAMLACAGLFVAVPALLSTGLPANALARLGLSAREAVWSTTGPLSAHLGVFVPPGWRASEAAADLFSAAAYLQILHHLTVLFVLPRTLAGSDAEDHPVVPWPRATVLTSVLVAGSAVGAVLFARDFVGSRAAYGLLASVHAWIEVPVLLLALAGPPSPLGRAPTPTGSPA